MIFYKDKFKQARKHLRWSKIRLSESCGVSNSSLDKWEAGKTTPTEKSIRKLARFLKIPVSTISNLPDDHPVAENNFTDDARQVLSIDPNIIEKERQVQELAISEIRRLGKKLTQTSTVIQALLSSMQSILYIKDTEQKYIAVNDAFRKYFDISDDKKVEELRDSDFMSIKETNENIKQDAEIIKTGKGIKNLERIIPGSRQKNWGLISKQPILDPLGRIEGITCNIIDITEEREAKDNLKTVTNTMNEIFATTVGVLDELEDLGIWLAKVGFDQKNAGHFYINPARTKIYEMDLKTMMDDPFFWRKNLHPDDYKRIVAESINNKEGKKIQKFRLVFPDGRIKYILETQFIRTIQDVKYSAGFQRVISKKDYDKLPEFQGFLKD